MGRTGQRVRELHVVAVSEDGRHVVLAGTRGATRGGFRVALDDRLAAALRGDLPRPGEVEPFVSELTPKQIQARLRTGESAESIAASAGVPVTRVERFSGPVEGEMARMIDAARAAFLVRGRLGRSAVPLGETVDAAIEAAPSLRPDSAEWSTLREESGTWLVTVTWYARRRSRRASWRYDPSLKTVAALDPASVAMGHASGQPAARPARKKAPAKKAPAKKAATKKTPAKKAAAKKAPPQKATTKKAAPAKVPRKAVRKPAAKPGAGARAARARALTVVPDPEPPTHVPPGRERQGATTGKRASVPGWADVLLGTTPNAPKADDR